MTAFSPKIYQQQVLDSIEAYFKACHALPSPAVAGPPSRACRRPRVARDLHSDWQNLERRLQHESAQAAGLCP